MALSVQEFSAKIKEKYPEYKNVDDAVLAQKIVDKYPEYKEKVDFTGQATGGQPDQQATKTPTQQSQEGANPFGAVGESIVNFGNHVSDFTKTAGKAILDSTVVPVAKGVAGAVVTGAKDIGAVAQGIGKVGYGLATNQNDDYYKKANEEINQQGTAPVEIPGLGNVNFNQANSQGNYDPIASGASELSHGIDAGIGAANIVNPVGGIGQNALRGGLQAAAQESQKEGSTPETIGFSGAFGAGTSAILSGLLNKVGGKSFLGKDAKLNAIGQPELNLATKARAGLAGINDTAASQLQKPTIGKLIMGAGEDSGYLAMAQKAKLDPTITQNPLQVVGTQYLKPAIETLNKVQKEAGTVIGSELKSIKQRVGIDNTLSNFKNIIEGFGGKFSNKAGVTFKDTAPIAKSASDVAALSDVGKTLQKYSFGGLPANEAHNLIQQIDGMINYSSKTAVPITDQAEGILKGVRKSLSTDLKSTLKANGKDDLVKVFKEYGKNQEVLNFFNPKLGSNSSSSTVLRNIFSPSAKDNTIPLLMKLGKVTGVDLLSHANAAKTAMELVGDTKGLNLFDVVNEMSPKGLLGNLTKAALGDPISVAKNIVSKGGPKAPAGIGAKILKEVTTRNIAAPLAGAAAGKLAGRNDY